ncbi:hypothetical protein G6F31_019574 [Rhizopus arrhizus]|nr:hypothetical protein G6F31_019574 [Rhizopus arrhizus]
MQRHPMRGRHVRVHVPQPVGRQRADQVRRRAQPCAGECRRDGVAAKGHGIVPRHALLVARGPFVGQHGDVDISVSNEERIAHGAACEKWKGTPRIGEIRPG